MCRADSRRDRHDSHKEEEPEWFSAGPVSKNDTIELHGFEKLEKKNKQKKQKQEERVEPRVVEVEEEEEKGPSTEGNIHNSLSGFLP